jgi:hypothetical protein
MIINGKKEDNLNQYDLSRDQIIIIDDLFPQWFIEHVHEQVFETYSWTYGHTSNYHNDPKYDIGADLSWAEVPAFKQQIYPPVSPNAHDSCWKMIYVAIASLIPFELKLGEILVNGQQWIHNTVEHTDCECDNGISWIYYANREWKEEWGGETVIKIDNEWQKIYPKPGRVFLFKGNIPHHGLPPNESYRGLRGSVVYKTMREVPLAEKTYNFFKHGTEIDLTKNFKQQFLKCD